MNLLDIIRRFLAAHGISGTVVVAVSGGGDSTALLLLLNDLAEVEIVAAHVNHHLRGADSDEDEAFVRELCGKIGVPVHVEDGTLDPAAVQARGVEAAAREVRERRLHEVRERVGARWIATAHHKNDQAETVLMRLIGGGGLASLRGVHPVREDGFIRPLLGIRRDQLADDLKRRRVVPRVDKSNTDLRFLRNRVRKFLNKLPVAAIDNLSNATVQATAQWRVLERLIEESDTSTATKTQTAFTKLPDDPWLRQAVLLKHIRRLDPQARDVGSADLERVVREIDTFRKVSITKNLELVRKGDAVILRRPPLTISDFELPLAPDHPAYVEDLDATITVKKTRNKELRTNNSQVFELPAGTPPNFVVRNRRDGDRFQPLGFWTEKKLKDFLIDRKIAAELRDRIPLVLWNGAIVWVAGVEVSERFRVTGLGDRYEVRLERAGDDEDQTGIQR